jgi:hypothetical protein
MKPEDWKLIEMVADGRFSVWECSLGISVRPDGSLLEAVRKIEAKHAWRRFAEAVSMITRAAMLPGQAEHVEPLTERFRAEWSRILYDALLLYPEHAAVIMEKAAKYLRDPTNPPPAGQGTQLFLERRTDTEPARPLALTGVEAACFAIALKWDKRLKDSSVSLTPTKRDIRSAWEKQKWFTSEAVVYARKAAGGGVKPHQCSTSEWTDIWKQLGLSDLPQGR